MLSIKKREKNEDRNITGREALFRKPGIRMWRSSDESEVPGFMYKSTRPAGINLTLETVSPIFQLGSLLQQRLNYT